VKKPAQCAFANPATKEKEALSWLLNLSAFSLPGWTTSAVAVLLLV
jgi:hypothetical protein